MPSADAQPMGSALVGIRLAVAATDRREEVVAPRCQCLAEPDVVRHFAAADRIDADEVISAREASESAAATGVLTAHSPERDARAGPLCEAVVFVRQPVASADRVEEERAQLGPVDAGSQVVHHVAGPGLEDAELTAVGALERAEDIARSFDAPRGDIEAEIAKVRSVL